MTPATPPVVTAAKNCGDMRTATKRRCATPTRRRRFLSTSMTVTLDMSRRSARRPKCDAVFSLVQVNHSRQWVKEQKKTLDSTATKFRHYNFFSDDWTRHFTELIFHQMTFYAYSWNAKLIYYTLTEDYRIYHFFASHVHTLNWSHISKFNVSPPSTKLDSIG